MPRHLYSIVTGLFLHLFMYREDVIHFFVMIVCVKILMHTISREKQPYIVFFFVVAHSTFYLLMDMIYRYGDSRLLYTYYTVILCQKLSTLGFCYKDGGLDDKDLSSHDRRCKLKEIPTFYELLSYNCYPMNCACGPFFEFADFRRFVNREGQYENPPLDLVKATLTFLYGFVCFGGIVVTGMVSNTDILVSKDFAELNWFMQMFHCTIVLENMKFAGYSLWFFADGVNILSGFSYNGKDKDGSNKYDINHGINYLGCELATTPRDLINNWNYQTTNWLKYYIYVRIEDGKKENRGLAALVTFGTSAFWHGFMPCYYVFFLYVHFLLGVSKRTYKLSHIFDYIPYPVRCVCGALFTRISFAYIGSLYLVRTGDRIIQFCYNTHFFGLWFIFAVYLLLKIAEPILGKDPKAKNDKQAGDKTPEKTKTD